MELNIEEYEWKDLFLFEFIGRVWFTSYGEVWKTFYGVFQSNLNTVWKFCKFLQLYEWP